MVHKLTIFVWRLLFQIDTENVIEILSLRFDFTLILLSRTIFWHNKICIIIVFTNVFFFHLINYREEFGWRKKLFGSLQSFRRNIYKCIYNFWVAFPLNWTPFRDKFNFSMFKKGGLISLGKLFSLKKNIPSQILRLNKNLYTCFNKKKKMAKKDHWSQLKTFQLF